MLILDANIILRFLLNDNAEMALEAKRLVTSGNAYVTIEVVAEVVYVLGGLYGLDRDRVSNALMRFLTLVNSRQADVLRLALQAYAAHKLDFVDCVLYAYHQVGGAQIATFDKKLLRCLNG